MPVMAVLALLLASLGIAPQRVNAAAHATGTVDIAVTTAGGQTATSHGFT